MPTPTSSVRGSTTGSVLPETASTHLPSISSCVCVVFCGGRGGEGGVEKEGGKEKGEFWAWLCYRAAAHATTRSSAAVGAKLCAEGGDYSCHRAQQHERRIQRNTDATSPRFDVHVYAAHLLWQGLRCLDRLISSRILPVRSQPHSMGTQDEQQNMDYCPSHHRRSAQNYPLT